MARCKPLVGKHIKATEVDETNDDESADSESEISYIIDLRLEEEKDTKMLESSEDEACESGIIDVRDIPELFIHENPQPCVENNYSQNVCETEGDEELEEHPHLIPVEITKTTSVNSSILPEASIPARSIWEGEHSFKIEVDCPKSTKRMETHSIYWESRNKLYVSKDYPFKVLVSAVNVPAASVIRVHADFCLPEDAYQIVQRCPTHAQQDYVKGNPAYEHVIHCLSEAACYDKNVTGRLSVSVPYWKPQNGETCSVYLFKLTCFNSCVGGINRRPFVMVFNLEKNGVSLGRQIMETRVCACPMRDFHIDMSKARSKTSVENNVPSSDSVETSKKYTISVKDPELYSFLKKMQSLYESSAYVNELMNVDV